jgi:hypothetical protein
VVKTMIVKYIAVNVMVVERRIHGPELKLVKKERDVVEMLAFWGDTIDEDSIPL